MTGTDYPYLMRFRPRFIGPLLLLSLVPALHAETSSSALINEALDKLIDIDVDTTLPQAIKAIEDKTGVPIEADQSVYDMLPWGEQTKLTAKISNQTLRQSLGAVCDKLGLRFRVGDEAVQLQPIPALRRIARRTTIDELGAIDTLSAHHVDDAAPTTTTVEGLAKLIDAQLAKEKSSYVVDNRATDDLGKAVIRLPRGVSYLAALEELHRQTRATWYPWGKSIVIVPKEDLIRTLLNRPITMRFNGVDVAQVLTELSRRSGVDFTIEPGAVQRIPPESRTIKLVLENVSTRQALESIAGFTGLGYVQNENGVYLWNPASNPVARRPDRVMALQQLDNGLQLLLPENEIPPDVKQYLDAKRAKAIQSLREQMKKEGFQPTTQPGNDL